MKSYDISATSKQITGYEGICRECFAPINTGEGMRFREGGLPFHKSCVVKNGHYIQLERNKADPLDRVDPVFHVTLKAMRGDYA